MSDWAKKQSVKSRSSAEEEYRGLADSSYKVLWLQNLLIELTIPVRSSHIPLFCDGKAVIDLTTNLVYHARIKHIELDVHFIRENIASGLIKVIQVASK